MYYMLGCFGPLDRDRASLENIPKFEGVSWLSGARTEAALPDPIEVDLDTDEGDAMVPMFQVGILMMSDEMIAAIREAGVDNLDCYNAVIRDPNAGIVYSNYKAVNIVGVIACADLGASEHVPYGTPVIDVDFDSLVIDETKTYGALMFRLAECITGIVVHDKVKQCLEDRGIKYLDFTPPEEWVG